MALQRLFTHYGQGGLDQILSETVENPIGYDPTQDPRLAAQSTPDPLRLWKVIPRKSEDKN